MDKRVLFRTVRFGLDFKSLNIVVKCQNRAFPPIWPFMKIIILVPLSKIFTFCSKKFKKKFLNFYYKFDSVNVWE